MIVTQEDIRHKRSRLGLRIAAAVCALSRNDRESVSITQRYWEAVRDEQVLTSARKTGVLANL